jgi:hypothetical protein
VEDSFRLKTLMIRKHFQNWFRLILHLVLNGLSIFVKNVLLRRKTKMSVNHYTTEMRLLVHNDSTGDYVVVKEDPDGLGMVGLSYVYLMLTEKEAKQNDFLLWTLKWQKLLPEIFFRFVHLLKIGS